MLLLAPVGCASAPYMLPPPPSEQVRAQLGTIGVVSAPFVPEAEFQTPARGAASGAGRGVATGAAKGFEFGAGLGCAGGGGGGIGAAGAGIICLGSWLAGGIIGTVVGGLGGAATAEPAATVEEAETALKKALADLNIQEAMQDRVLQVARQQTRHPLVLLTDPSPTTRDEEISYSSLTREGIDTVLEVSVPTLGLAGKWGVNPPLVLVMAVRTRLISVVDDAVLYDSTLEYGGRKLTFTEWAVDEARPFREELGHAYQSLAEKIVEELFLLYDLPLKPRADQHEQSGVSY